MIQASRILLTISRERAARRVTDGFDHFESQINLAKLPPGFLNFERIDVLPSRELAYTAHLAGRLGMENEELWEKIRSAFLESAKSMSGKQVTQCLVALVRRDALQARDLSQILRIVSSSVTSFRPLDLVLVLHAASSPSKGKIDKSQFTAIIESLSKRISTANVSPKSIAVLTGALGKLGIDDENLMSHLLESVLANKARFNEHEVAAIVRTIASVFPTASGQDLVIQLLGATDVSQMEPPALNIVLNSLWKMGLILDEKLRKRIWSQVSSSLLLAEPDLLPHLLLSCCGALTVDDSEGLALCLRIATNITRQYKHFKAVALPVAVEGVKLLQEKYPENPDVRAISETLSAVSQSVIERFLLVAPEQERQKVLESKYCFYSDWLREQVGKSLVSDKTDKEDLRSVSGIIIQIQEGKLSPEEVATLVPHEGVSPEDLLKLVWLNCPLSESLNRVLEDITGPKSNTFYSLAFRWILRDEAASKTSIDQILKLFVPDMKICEFKTICRALQVVLRFPLGHSVEMEAMVLESLNRISELATEDLHGYLSVLNRLGVRFDETDAFAFQFADSVEAKIAVELSQVKSLSRRMQIEALARNMGLSDPQDLIEDLEKNLAVERSRPQKVES